MNERDYMDFIDSQFSIDEQMQIDDEMCEYCGMALMNIKPICKT